MVKRIGLALLILLVLAVVFKDIIIKQAVVSVGSSVLGAPVKIGGFSLGLLTNKVNISDLQIGNPSGFTNTPLIDIAHIKAEYLPLDLIRGKLYFSLIDLDVRQLAIERNKQGGYNAASLKIKPQQSNEPLDMRIDVLKLNIDKVTLRDEAKGGQVKETSQGVGLRHRVFKNITSPQQLVALVIFESSGLGDLSKMAWGTSKSVIQDATQMTKGVAQEAQQTVHSLFDSVKSVVNK